MSIAIEGLHHRYDGQAEPAVDDLSLAVADGELYVLLGPSGCGKTTTMRCIAGLETPLAGRIVVGDRPMVDVDRKVNVPVHKRNIGMVFQSYAIWPHKTVYENVAFPLRMQGTDQSATRERVAEVLDIVGLQGYEKRGASLLSGGQMQRVALARSIAMRPRVLLFDEPLSNLDARLRESLRFELRSIQQEFGFTAIYVTHDQSEALALGDRIAVMRSGRIVQEGKPVDLYRDPTSRFVAEFLGVGNIFDATVLKREDAGGVRIRLEGSQLELSSAFDAPVGEPVTVCIRDEEVRLQPDGTGEAENEIPGIIDVASFLGREIRYQCVVSDEVRFQSSMPSSVESQRAGSSVVMSIKKEAVQLVDVGSEALHAEPVPSGEA